MEERHKTTLQPGWRQEIVFFVQGVQKSDYLCVSANAMQYSLKLKMKTKHNYSTFANGFQEIIKFLQIIFLVPSQLCMQWKFGFRVINHWSFAPTYCRCTLEFYFTLFLRKCRNYQYVFFSWWSWDKRCLARSSSARSWREPSTASSWQDRDFLTQILIWLDFEKRVFFCKF